MNECVKTFTANELADRWALSAIEIRREVSRGRLIRLRRNGYAWLGEDDDQTNHHLALIDATGRLIGPSAAFSHLSAAVLWALPLWKTSLGRAWVTNPSPGHGRISVDAHYRRCPLPAWQVMVMHGQRCTSLARTTLDLARSLPLSAGVAAADAALRNGLEPNELAEVAEFQRGWPGIRRARLAVGLADRLAESPLESASRVSMHQLGVPTPQLQYEVFDQFGEFLARSDFAWPELGVLGECDGRTKYEQLTVPNQSPAAVIMREKERDQRLRDHGWWVVHWSATDLNNDALFEHRLNRALQHGGTRAA